MDFYRTIFWYEKNLPEIIKKIGIRMLGKMIAFLPCLISYKRKKGMKDNDKYKRRDSSFARNCSAGYLGSAWMCSEGWTGSCPSNINQISDRGRIITDAKWTFYRSRMHCNVSLCTWNSEIIFLCGVKELLQNRRNVIYRAVISICIFWNIIGCSSWFLCCGEFKYEQNKISYK